MRWYVWRVGVGARTRSIGGFGVRVLKSVAFAVTLGLVLPALASAATLNVAPGGHDDAGNPSGCSAQPGGSFRCVTLRDAIAFANAGLAGANPTVKLAAGTYTLSNGALTLTVPLTVSGTGDSGAGASTIRQTGPDIVFRASNALKLNSLVVTGANATGPNATTGSPAVMPGAAISVNGSLALNRVAVVGNHAVGGAGLAQDNTNQFGTGGGVLGSAVQSNGALSISNSIVSGNAGIGGAGGSSNGVNPGGAGNGAVGAIFGVGPVSIANSQITNNSAIGGAGGANTGGGEAGAGGAAVGTITSAGSMSITGSTISGNSTTGGAGGSAAGANATGGAGGAAAGVSFSPRGQSQTLAVSNTTISGNTANGGAGGTATGEGGGGGVGGPAIGAALDMLSVGVATASIAASTIANNTSSAGLAGADTAQSGAGGLGGGADGAIDDSSQVAGTIPSQGIPLRITASTLSGNQAISSAGGAGGAGGSTGIAGGAAGGALRAASGATVTIVNSTVFANSVQSAGGAQFPGLSGSFGGGIEVIGPGTGVSLFSDTVAGNSASAALGPQVIFGPNLDAENQGAFSLTDTAVVSLSPGGGGGCSTEGGTYTDLGRNLQDAVGTGCGLGGAGMGDQLVTNSGLSTRLGANGGPTMTLAPQAGSAVIGNGGVCANPLGDGAVSPLRVDQRGLPRSICDIGAFQTQPIKLTGKPKITGTPAVGHTLTCAKGTLGVTGDGIFTATGAIGVRQTKTSFTSNGAPVSQRNTYTLRTSDNGHSITCTIVVTGAYGQARATSSAVHVTKRGRRG